MAQAEALPVTGMVAARPRPLVRTADPTSKDFHEHIELGKPAGTAHSQRSVENIRG